MDFTYNVTGDATGMTITDAGYKTTLGDTETFDGFIVNAKTGRAIDPYNLEVGSKVALATWRRYEEQRVTVAPMSSGIYTIRFYDNWNLGLKTINSGTSTYHEVGDVGSDHSAVPIESKFEIISNGDGTFRILTGESGFEKALSMSDAKFESGYYKLTANDAYDSDDLGQQWYLVDLSYSYKIETSATYTDNGKYILTSTDQAGNTTKYGYNGTADLTTVIDPEGNRTTYTYDAIGRTKTVCSALNDVEYTYSKDNISLISVDGGNIVYDFVYDKFGRNSSVTVGNGTDSYTLATYEYTDQELSKQTYGNGDYAEFSYDSIDRISEKSYSDSIGTVQYYYDSDGNLYKVKDGIASVATVAEFDLAGRTVGVSATSIDGKSLLAYISTAYTDGKGTVEKQSSTIFGEDNTVDYNLDYRYTYYDAGSGRAAGSLYRFSVNGELYEYVYDDIGRVVQIKSTIGNVEDKPVSVRVESGKSESYTYLDSTISDGATTTLIETYTDILGIVHTYTYDGLGNILTETIDDGTTKYLIEYEYDSQSRLTRCNDEYLGYTVAYEYDARGNIIAWGEYEYTQEELTDDLLYYYCQYSYDNSTWKDLLTEVDGAEITYDAIGNPNNWFGKALTWQNGRQLATYGSGSNIVTYGYDGDGLRISKSGARNTEYIVVGGTYLGERTTIDGTEYLITYIYGNSGVVGINVNGTNYYFAKNVQGDITAILAQDGTVIARYAYNAWGSIYSITDGNGNDISVTNKTHIANLNPFRYRGYMYDQETEFYYLTTRYYDPFVGRFINADGLVSTGIGLDGYNMFAYCNNNPIMLSDPEGNCPGTHAHIRRVCAGLETCDQYHDMKDSLAARKREYAALQAVQEKSLIENFKNSDGSYSLHNNDRHGDNNSWNEKILNVSCSSPSLDLDLTDGNFSAGLGSLEVDVTTGGWIWDQASLSLLDFGHAEIACQVNNTGFEVAALASIWSPSVSVSLFGVDLECSVEVGSVGACLAYKNGVFKIGAASSVGVSLSVKKS